VDYWAAAQIDPTFKELCLQRACIEDKIDNVVRWPRIVRQRSRRLRENPTPRLNDHLLHHA
jgi:hypothetical protein